MEGSDRRAYIFAGLDGRDGPVAGLGVLPASAGEASPDAKVLEREGDIEEILALLYARAGLWHNQRELLVSGRQSRRHLRFSFLIAI
jgi:hypothetical protein